MLKIVAARCGISGKQSLLSFLQAKLYKAAIQADRELWKGPHDGLVQPR
jgi:hypothetical protein